MILLTHIVIALSSIIFTSFLLFHTTQAKLNISYALVGATLASGIYLTIVNPASMLHLCTSGLVYIILVSAGITVARKRFVVANRLAAEKVRS